MALTLDLDESIVDHELRLEIDRCYSYLGTPVVRTHPAADGEPVNTLRMTVRVGAREYLDSSVEGADALWSDSIEHWLLNQVHAVDNQMKIFNRRQREEGKPELVFTWLEIELQGGRLVVRLRLDSTCGIDPEESKWVSRVREALNAGALGKDVVAVTLPSAASYEKQYAAGMEALETRKEAEAAAARAAEEAAAAEAEAAEKARRGVVHVDAHAAHHLLNLVVPAGHEVHHALAAASGFRRATRSARWVAMPSCSGRLRSRRTGGSPWR